MEREKGGRRERESEVCGGRERDGERKRRAEEREKEISIRKNKEYKKEKIFCMEVLKTIHKKISNQKMKSKERDKSILQCMYNNVHTVIIAKVREVSENSTSIPYNAIF